MKSSLYVFLLVLLTALTGCQEKSLQKYLVEKQDDPHFLKADIAPGMFDGFTNSLENEEREVLNRVKKVNLVAYKIDETNRGDYQKEKEEVQKILKQDKYIDLTRIKSNSWSAQFLYVGKETAIDEVIVFASDDEKGFAIARLVGDKIQPEHLLKIIQATESGDFNVSAIEEAVKIFQN